MQARKLYLFGIGLIICWLLASQALSQYLTLTVSEDAHIDQNEPDTNFDGEDILIAQRDSYGKKIYLKFNASHLAMPISDITAFEFDYAGRFGRYGQAYLITGEGANDWNEAAITWNNAPANDTQSATNFLPDAVFIGQVDITDYDQFGTVEMLWNSGAAKDYVLEKLSTGNRIATIAISRTGDRSVQYFSKEAQGDVHPIRMNIKLMNYGNSDINNDGIIDFQDLSIMTEQWLQTGLLTADITADEKVCLEDYSILAGSWLEAPPFPLELYNHPMTDDELLSAFNLDLPQLSAVKYHYENQNYANAISELASYYRGRQGVNWWFDPHQIDPSVGNESSLNTSYDIMDGIWSEVNWFDSGTPDWLNYNYTFLPRMYFLTSIGVGYWYSGTEYPAAYAYLKVLRSWVNQIGEGSVYWGQMTTGIRMRSGWGDSFNYFLNSPVVTDRDMTNHIKSSIQQLRYLRDNMSSNVPNHLTFARAGLYAGGTLFHELNEAQDWRNYAAQTAITAMTEDHLPDGSSLELSPGYSQFFLSNYLEGIYDFAVLTGRENEDYIEDLIDECEKAADFYVRLMTPDRKTPSYNNNTGPDVASLMERLVDKYPHREDFLWIATDGQQGSEPDYTSYFLPYSGYAAMRSGWETNANYLGFINSPTGRTHCHMDKLNIVLWAYGRQIIFESEGSNNDNSNPWSVYSQDTFSHNTGLVDNRPQRRNWGTPNPSQMPYQPLSNVQWQTTPEYDYAWGVYNDSYGKQGASDSYPYTAGSNFYDDWVNPTHHYRKVFFLKPDIFIINDMFVTQDSQPHDYEIRFHISSTNRRTRNGNWLYTIDNNVPNLEVVPLMSSGLTTNVIQGQTDPQLMGWNVTGSTSAQQATTIQYLKTGDGTVEFLTLLVPRTTGVGIRVNTASQTGDNSFEVSLHDGRALTIQTSEDPYAAISAAFD